MFLFHNLFSSFLNYLRQRFFARNKSLVSKTVANLVLLTALQLYFRFAIVSVHEFFFLQFSSTVHKLTFDSIHRGMRIFSIGKLTVLFPFKRLKLKLCQTFGCALDTERQLAVTMFNFFVS